MEDNYTGINWDNVNTMPEGYDPQPTEEELEEERLAQQQLQLQQQQAEQEKALGATPEGMKPVNNERTGGETTGFSDGDNYVPNTPEDLAHANTPANEFGAGENWTEAGNAWNAGVSSAAGSTLSFTERMLDRMNGEDTSSEDYEPDWDPWGKTSPLHKTWWGGLIYETSKALTYATTFTVAAGAIGIGAAGTALGAAGRGVIGAAAEGVLDQDTDKASSNVGKGLYDAAMAENENLINGITNQVPALEPVLKNNPFRVRPEDSPEWIKFKNVMELIGITGAAEFVTGKLFGNPDAAKARTDDVRTQTVEKGKQELADELRTMEVENQLGGQVIDVEVIPDRAELPAATEALPGTPNRAQLPGDQTPQAPPGPGTFRGSKNKPMADPWQGAHTSRSTPFDVAQQSKKIYETGSKGSADGLVTPAAAERMYNQNGIDPDLQRIKAKELLGEERFQRLMEEVKQNNKSFQSVFNYAFAKQQEVMGRFATAVDGDDFWKPIMDEVSFRTGGTDSMEAWAMENVVAADLVNASLFSKMRDTGIAINEISGIADFMDTDGPIKTITDYMLVGMENVKRSRYLISGEFRKLQGDPTVAKKAVKERMKNIHEETKKNIEMMIEVMISSDDPKMAMKFAEYFSKADKIQNWADLDAYMRLKVKGAGMFNDTSPGVMFNELDGVITNSILSGPKTAWRAIQGTGTVGMLRPITTAIGSLGVDGRTFQRSLASLNAMRQMIPEAWTLMKSELDSGFNKNVLSIENRYQSTRLDVKDDLEAYNFWLKHRKSETHAGDWAAGQIAGIAYGLNKNRVLSGIPRVMGAVDRTNDILLARARARQQALTAAMDRHPGVKVSDEMIAEYEDLFMKNFVDENGDLDIKKMRESDPYLAASQKEATLTADLKGFVGDIEKVFKKFPFTRPFFRFARTAVNGQMLTYKNTPLLGAMHKEFGDVMFHKGDDFTKLTPYGIANQEDLFAHQALLRGRQYLGGAVVTTGAMMYLDGRLTGPGPTDEATRRLWRKLGYPFNSVKVWTPAGDKWIGYESFEPYNTILSTIATIGDNQKLMGDDWVETNLFSHALSIGLASSTKSYLDIIDDIMKLGTDPSAGERIFANLVNNTVPGGQARNTMGKILQPYTLELTAGWTESIKNRNRLTQQNEAPIKVDFLNGKPLRDWNVWERFYDAFSPIPIRNDFSEGRRLLFESGYNLDAIGYTVDGIDLKDSPKVIEAYHRAMGAQGVESKLDELAKDPLSWQHVEDVLARKDHPEDPLNQNVTKADNPTAKRIQRIMSNAQRRAWASLSDMPEVKKLIEDARVANKGKRNESNPDRTYAPPLILKNK